MQEVCYNISGVTPQFQWRNADPFLGAEMHAGTSVWAEARVPAKRYVSAAFPRQRWEIPGGVLFLRHTPFRLARTPRRSIGREAEFGISRVPERR